MPVGGGGRTKVITVTVLYEIFFGGLCTVLLTVLDVPVFGLLTAGADCLISFLCDG